MARRVIRKSSSLRSYDNPRQISYTKRETTSLSPVIGLHDSPGGGHMPITERLLYNSTLMMTIQPCKPNFEEGMNLFRLEEDWQEYREFLEIHGVTPNPEHESIKGIKIAAMVDSLPTDTFTNEYGEHFLNKITDVAGSAFGEAAQMMGKTTGTGAGKEFGKNVGGPIGSLITGSSEWIEDFIKNLGSGSGALKGMADIANQLLAGARVDFPMVWKNSSYSSSYSFNIRLYNPNPKDLKATKQYIVNPLIALLTLALPRTKLDSDTSVYRWPFFCKVDCKGLFSIQSGAITNVTIQKGGEAGLIAYNQRPGMVDVKIDMINLFSTMIDTQWGADVRPTLSNYVWSLVQEKEQETTLENEPSVSNDQLGVNLSQIVVDASSTADQRVPDETLAIFEQIHRATPYVVV